jgi:hypothetical protein
MKQTGIKETVNYLILKAFPLGTESHSTEHNRW